MDKESSKKDILVRSQKSLFESFFNDEIQLIIFKRTEKLSTVMFYIKDNFYTEEDLQRSLLRTSRQIMSFASSLIRTDKGHNEYAEQLVQSLIELSSVISFGYMSECLTYMNYSVIQKEIKDVVSLIKRELLPHTSRGKVLDHDIFIQKQRASTGTHVQTQAVIKDTDTRNTDDVIKKTFMPNESIKDKAKNNVKDIKKPSIAVKDKLNERREKIITIVKELKSVSVKDVSMRISDCGEKTIQRMVNDLVDTNVLKKEGERRWSRYSIA